MDFGIVSGVAVGVSCAAIMYGIFAVINVGPLPSIAVEEALARGGAIVDVGTPEEFAAGHVAGARNLPADALPGRLGELDRGKPVIVYCATGRRGAPAAKALRKAGFRVVNAGTFRAFAEHLQPAA